MMIDKYISALLYRHQCVIVPGFGAFLTEFQSASFNESNQTFFPPKKVISFNSQLTYNDGLLANHIALQEGISYEKAVKLISEFVSEGKQILSTEKTISFKNIGDITVNSESNMIFEPQSSANYLASSFGLSSLSAPYIERELIANSENKEVPVVLLPARKQKKYNFLKYAAVFALIAGVAAPIYKQQQDLYVSNQIVEVNKSIQNKVNDQIEQATFFIEPPLSPVVLAVKEEVKPYHIVANAFRSEENAAKEVKDLQAKGFDASFLEKNKYNLYPVIYGSYADLKEAQDSLRSIHKKHNKEAWLLVK